jgi:pimeloyl-ACP methyl ester carboxylesterase
MKTLLSGILFLLSFSINAQVYSVGHRQLSFTDPSRSNRSIPAEIYYPSNTDGDNVPIAAGSFPVLVFGHGFLMTYDAYNVVWNAIVPEGFILVFPKTEGSISPSHTDFGKDLAFVVGAMKSEGLNASSTFYNSISQQSAVMGHSMGGGSAFLAVQYDPSITALATLAAAVTNPSSVTAASGITIPSLTISGANDCIAPPTDHQLPMYAALNSGCKSYVSILGASHCQFAGTSFTCSIGEATCSPGPAIAPNQQQLTAAVYLINFLKFYLKDDCAAGEEFQTMITTAISIDGDQNCALVCSSILDKNKSDVNNITLFPNPAQDELCIIAEKRWSNLTVELLDLYGNKQQILFLDSGMNYKIPISNLANGVYVIRLSDSNLATITRRIIIAR